MRLGEFNTHRRPGSHERAEPGEEQHGLLFLRVRLLLEGTEIKVRHFRAPLVGLERLHFAQEVCSRVHPQRREVQLEAHKHARLAANVPVDIVAELSAERPLRRDRVVADGREHHPVDRAVLRVEVGRGRSR